MGEHNTWCQWYQATILTDPGLPPSSVLPKTPEHPKPASCSLFLPCLQLPRASSLTGHLLRKIWDFLQTKLPVVAHTIFLQAEWQSCTRSSNFFKELGFVFVLITVTREGEKTMSSRSFFNKKPYLHDFFVFQVEGIVEYQIIKKSMTPHCLELFWQ